MSYRADADQTKTGGSCVSGGIFDSYLAPGPSSVRARPAVVAGAALAAHLAIAGALVISSAWDIEKLAPDENRLTLAGPIPRPMPGGGDGERPEQGPESEPKPQNKTKKRSRKQKQSATNVQPSDQQPDDMIVGDAATDGDDDDGDDVFTHPDGCNGCTGTGINIGTDDRCPMPICGTDVIPADVEIPKIEKKEPVIVPSQWLDGHLVSGVEKIHPPDGVRVAMQQDGRSQTRASILMCLTKEGRVRSLDVQRSSGYQAYDAALLREMRRWRYEPYKMNGVAVEVCTAVTFIYRMR